MKEREKKERTDEESHLKPQVDTQTKFVLPAVPKLSRRGQPGANSCFAWRGGSLGRTSALTPEASRTAFQYSGMQRRLLPISSVSWSIEDPPEKKKSPRKLCSRKTVCTLILLSLFYLFSFFNVFY